MKTAETIVAPITALAPAAVALVRISGPRAWAVAKQVFNPWPDPVRPRYAQYGRFVTGDDGLALPFAESASYTGEESVEFSVHGSLPSVDTLVQACLQAGCRLAEPGEFTLRAFMNGRIDLTQAEGVRATVEAATATQLRTANQLRSGALTDDVKQIRESCLQLLSMVEASTDFSEEIGDLDHAEAERLCQQSLQKIDRLLATEAVTRLHQNGARIAIVGLPNAGKSSLLNALLRQDRAIVTPIPGTTRDTVEETVDLNGIPVRFIDTAGLRETPDQVEQIGVERAIQASQSADLVLYLYDANTGWQAEDSRLHQSIQRPTILVANKADLNPDPPQGIPISSKTGQNLEVLIQTISSQLTGGNQDDPSYLLDRHFSLLHQAKDAITETLTTVTSPHLPDDLASVTTRQAIRVLGEITGETASADIIQEIFARFCIGK